MFSYYDIAGISYEPNRLPQYQHRIQTEDTISDDDARPDKTDYPEPDRQDGLLTFIGIIPLIDESDGKYHLTRRTEDEQRNRDIVIMEKIMDESWYIRQHETDSHDGQYGYQKTEYNRYFVPDTFHIEIPNIDVIRNQLSEDDGEIITHPTVTEQQDAADETANPIQIRRDDTLAPL
jgi:hypothetical protein